MAWTSQVMASVLIAFCWLHPGCESRRTGRQRHRTTSTTPMTPPPMVNSDIGRELSQVYQRNPSTQFNYGVDYNYLINNPGLCAAHARVTLLLAVLSAPEHTDRRMAIRDTWAATYNLPHHRMVVIFLLANTSHIVTRTSINSESELYGDIIQADFMDSPENVSLKTVLALQWARTYCSNAKFQLLTSDFVLVDVFRLVPYLLLEEHSIETLRLYCLSQRNSCCNDPRPHIGAQTMLANCTGLSYVFPSSVITAAYHASLLIPRTSHHDAFVCELYDKLSFHRNTTMTDSYAGPLSSATTTVERSTIVFKDVPIVTLNLLEIYGSNGVAKALRRLWLTMVAKQHDPRSSELNLYTQIPERTDHHIYTVALVALGINAIVIFSAMYALFYWKCCCRWNGISYATKRSAAQC